MKQQPPATLDRRSLLKSAGILAAAGAVLPAHASAPTPQRGSETAPKADRLIRVAHLTDTHVQPERKAAEGLEATLAHVLAQADRPDVIITGGDLIMDSFGATRARTREQWDLFNRVFASCRVPVRHTIGNHDIWGWDKKKAGCRGDEAEWGKRWAVDELGLQRAHYTFAERGVVFIVLDSVQPHGDDGYRGGLDDAQFEWLAGELARARGPVVVVSHIPILHASLILSDSDARPDGKHVAPGEMFMDCRRVTNLLARHPHVKAALSGHIHVVERLDYRGVAYINSGAVCGNWWKSQDPHKARLADPANAGNDIAPPRCEPGYGLIDVFTDGRIGFEYVETGWALASS